jgi:hypothetical protein
VPLYAAHFLIRETNTWNRAATAGDSIEKVFRAACHLFTAADSAGAYSKATAMIPGLSDAHNDGPGQRTEISGVGLLDLCEVEMFGRTMEQQLDEIYGIGAGMFTLHGCEPRTRTKEELDVFRRTP